MKNGLFDIGALSFVFTPLALTVALLLCVWRNQIKDYFMVVMHFVAGGPNVD